MRGGVHRRREEGGRDRGMGRVRVRDRLEGRVRGGPGGQEGRGSESIGVRIRRVGWEMYTQAVILGKSILIRSGMGLHGKVSRSFGMGERSRDIGVSFTTKDSSAGTEARQERILIDRIDHNLSLSVINRQTQKLLSASEYQDPSSPSYAFLTSSIILHH